MRVRNHSSVQFVITSFHKKGTLLGTLHQFMRAKKDSSVPFVITNVQEMKHWLSTSNQFIRPINIQLFHLELQVRGSQWAQKSKPVELLDLKLSKLSCLVLVVFIEGHRIGPNVQFCFKTDSHTPSFNYSNGCRPLKMGPIWNLMSSPNPKFFIFQLLLLIQSDCST